MFSVFGNFRLPLSGWLLLLMAVTVVMLFTITGHLQLYEMLYWIVLIVLAIKVFCAECDEDRGTPQVFRVALLVPILLLFYEHWVVPVAHPFFVCVYAYFLLP